MQLVIASRNVHKIRELRAMLKGQKQLDVLSLLNYSEYVALAEQQSTLQEVARSKAEHAAQALNSWVIADDSGLFVPSLEGAPGVNSRRYAGSAATDIENRHKLLAAMDGMTDFQRYAYFECCLVLASPQGIKKIVTSQCEGYITTEERGRNGFGYDPIFIKHEYDKTFAEIEESIKNRFSHRYKAFEKLLPTLENLSTYS